MSTHTLHTEECLALLRDASLRSESIAEEMECAGHAAPAPAEVAAARSLLEELASAPGASAEQGAALAKGIGALPDALALAVLRAAAEASRQDVLRDVAQGPSRALSKEAKRELQRLKQKGVKVEPLPTAGAPVLRPPPEAEAPSCYASSIDAYGERAVWFARAGRNGVEVVQAVISDVRGILAVDALGLSRKSWREFVRRMPRKPVVTTVEVSRDHARGLIAHAAEEGARNGFTPAQGYGEALQLLGPAPSAPLEPPALDFGPEGEAQAAQAGAFLFDDPLMASWIPEEDALRAYGLKRDEIATSQLYLDDAQRAAAAERAADEAASAYFTKARRVRYARRLAEMARVFAAEGRASTARTALAVARQLEAEGGPLNPFCRALFSHAWAAVPPGARGQPQPGAGAAGSSPLIAPG